MSVDWLLALLGLLACLAASAAYSGSEIGFYGLSRTRVDLEARVGRRPARWIQRLMGDDTALLITILVGNNLALELASRLGARVLPEVSVPELQAVMVTLVLTPVVFLFGEALPKDLFRRRPHAWVQRTAGFILLSRYVFWPLERLLRGLSFLLERSFGLGAQVHVPVKGREVMLHVLAEGLRSGALPARAEVLARNALELRSIPVERAMTAWDRVETLGADLGARERFERVRASSHTRLPVVDAQGTVLGYVHQLDVLEAGPEAEGPPVQQHSLGRLAPETPVDRALLTLRGSGRRMALVEREGVPVGIVTLKDLVEEISGELAEW